jgi:hypothetical protein
MAMVDCRGLPEPYSGCLTHKATAEPCPNRESCAPVITRIVPERRTRMALHWINQDGSTTPINSPQDVAAALDNDPETADALAEELSKEIEEKD